MMRELRVSKKCCLPETSPQTGRGDLLSFPETYQNALKKTSEFATSGYALLAKTWFFDSLRAGHWPAPTGKGARGRFFA